MTNYSDISRYVTYCYFKMCQPANYWLSKQRVLLFDGWQIWITKQIRRNVCKQSTLLLIKICPCNSSGQFWEMAGRVNCGVGYFVCLSRCQIIWANFIPEIFTTYKLRFYWPSVKILWMPHANYGHAIGFWLLIDFWLICSQTEKWHPIKGKTITQNCVNRSFLFSFCTWESVTVSSVSTDHIFFV